MVMPFSENTDGGVNIIDHDFIPVIPALVGSEYQDYFETGVTG